MPVVPGQPLKIQASVWNRLEKLASVSNGGVQAAGPQGALPAGHVRILNSSGSDIARGGVLSWSNVKFDHDDNPTDYWKRPLYTGKVPEFPEDHGRIAIAQTPVKDGTVGVFAVDGSTAALVNISDINHHFAFLGDGNVEELKSGTSGNVAIEHVTGTGDQCMCRIRLNSSQTLWRYKLKEAFGATTENQAEADLLGMDAADSGVDAMILDPLEMFSDQAALDAGFCMQVGGSFFALQAPCVS